MNKSCDLSDKDDLVEKTDISILKDYKLAGVIGSGGFGIVYMLKLENGPSQFYAIKSVDISTEENKLKFQREKNLFKVFSKGNRSIKCVHKNINCHLYISDKDDCGYIITQYFDTDLFNDLRLLGSFDKRVSANRDYYLPQFSSWISQLSKGIKFLRERDIAHGDLKPSNILIRYLDNQIAITDFDTVCLGKRSNNRCYVSDMTVYYASPELYHHYRKEVDISIIMESDIWALAYIVLEMWMSSEELKKFFFEKTKNPFANDFYTKLHIGQFDKLFNYIDESVNGYKLGKKLSLTNEQSLKDASILHNILSSSAIMLFSIWNGKTKTTDFDNYLKKLIIN